MKLSKLFPFPAQIYDESSFGKSSRNLPIRTNFSSKFDENELVPRKMVLQRFN